MEGIGFRGQFRWRSFALADLSGFRLYGLYGFCTVYMACRFIGLSVCGVGVTSLQQNSSTLLAPLK